MPKKQIKIELSAAAIAAWIKIEKGKFPQLPYNQRSKFFNYPTRTETEAAEFYRLFKAQHILNWFNQYCQKSMPPSAEKQWFYYLDMAIVTARKAIMATDKNSVPKKKKPKSNQNITKK